MKLTNHYNYTRISHDEITEKRSGGFQDHERRVINAYHRFVEAPYDPECLIIYLSNRCQMGCGYCYAAHAGNGHHHRHENTCIIDEHTVRRAAQLVARHCARRHRPLRVVFYFPARIGSFENPLRASSQFLHMISRTFPPFSALARVGSPK